MLKIESNLKLNGRHWGLAFTDGVAHTTNVSLAAKLLLKGYVVTDQQPEAEHTVAGDINIIQTASTTPASPIQAKPALKKERPEQPEVVPLKGATAEPQREADPNNPASKKTAKATKPKPAKTRKRAVKADATDGG